MNADQKRQLQAEFASGRMHTDNDNAKPDYRRILVQGEKVRAARKAWMTALENRTEHDAARIVELMDAYDTELFRYFNTSEDYWGRR